MTDVRNSLRLVIPDYFGFNVVHYDPVSEERGAGDCPPAIGEDPGCGDCAMDTTDAESPGNRFFKNLNLPIFQKVFRGIL